MRDVLEQLAERYARGESIALATVVRTFRSAPRPAGASMLRCADGSVVGSVSGGCVEGAVYELAGDVLDTGAPALERYGVSDDDAFAVGLTCGGILDIFVEPISSETYPEFGEVASDIAAEHPVAVATVIAHDDPGMLGRHLIVRPDSVQGSLGDARVDAVVTADIAERLADGTTGPVGYGSDGTPGGADFELFVAAFAPRPRLLVFGAIDFAAALARQGALVGYHVTVCDARPLFVTAERFPDVDELVRMQPAKYLAAERDAGRLDRHTAVCVLTHDPKFDVPALIEAFTLPESVYIGAMGSRRTHEDRVSRLREQGATEGDLARLHSPIGLNIGSRTPEETAVAIVAEVIAWKWGGRAESLVRTAGAIHGEPMVEETVRG